MKSGFTLVELLAVIVVLAVILAIAIFGVSGVVSNVREKSFMEDARMVIKALDIKRAAEDGYDIGEISLENIQDELGISGANYASLSFQMDEKNPYVMIAGTGKWEGLIACGNKENLSVGDGTDCVPVAAPDSCFGFNSGTGTITSYDFENCPTALKIPSKINGVTVEHIGNAAFVANHYGQYCYNGSNYTPVGDDYARDEEDGYINCFFNINPETSGLLTSVFFPNGLLTIGTSAFVNHSLSKVVLPNSVTYVADDCFFLNQITDITLSSKMTSINPYVFEANNLSQISIPNNITHLGDFAFAYNNLTSLVIPATVTTIGASILSGNPDIASVTVVSDNPNYKSVNNAIYNKTGTKLILGTGGMSNNIENTITRIGRGAMFDMGITSITIPSLVTHIESCALAGNQLTEVDIPAGVNNIGIAAFQANNLNSITIPNTVTQIGGSAFSYNNLASITIPSSVAYLGNYSLQSNVLTTIQMGGSTTSLGSQLLTNNDAFKTLYTSGSGGAGTYTASTQTGVWAKQP